MRRTPIALSALAAAALGIGALVAPASVAAPPPAPEKPDAVVSPAAREHTWSASGVVLYGGWGEVEDMQCLDAAVAEDVCDFEYVQVDLPESGEAPLEIGFDTTGPLPSDFDLTVYDPSGRVVATGTSAVGETGENVKIRVKKAGVYVVEIAHYLSVGGGYEAYFRMK